MSKGYDYIKPQFRGHEGAVQPGFRGLRFHPAPVTRVKLTWMQRWQALNRFQWWQFWTGVRFEIHVYASEGVAIIKSQYAPGGGVEL